MINYEMALSEIEMYKKAHKSLSENLTHANKKAQQFKAERDTLIDDLSWYKAKVSRLERELASALNGELIKYDELQEYVLELQSELKKCQKEYEKLNNTAEEALDIAESENCKVQRLERENRFLLSRKDNLFDSWRDENKRSVALSKRLEQLKRENNNLKQSVSEYKDYAESHAASYLEFKSLEHENKRLTRLTHKLTIHRTMWDKLKDWRRDMLEIDKNDTQLISLGLVMDELEQNWLYKEDE